MYCAANSMCHCSLVCLLIMKRSYQILHLNSSNIKQWITLPSLVTDLPVTIELPSHSLLLFVVSCMVRQIPVICLGWAGFTVYKVYNVTISPFPCVRANEHRVCVCYLRIVYVTGMDGIDNISMAYHETLR